MVEAEHSAGAACHNCGATLTGAFCAACGQSEHDGHPPTVGLFFHDVVHEFAHVDGKIFATLKALFFQPGKLTEEYWAGHVVSWVRPIRIFLIAAALHLWLGAGVGPLNFQVQLERKPDGDLNVNIASDIRRLAGRGGNIAVSEEERQRFLEKFEHDYAAIRYGSVLVFALAAWLLYRRRQPYFVSQLIGGLHFYSFWYVLALLASFPGRHNAVWNSLSLLSVIYLFLALGRLFRDRWYWQLLKTMVLYVVMLATELALGFAAANWVEWQLNLQ